MGQEISFSAFLLFSGKFNSILSTDYDRSQFTSTPGKIQEPELVPSKYWKISKYKL